MSAPKNRDAVLEALQLELLKDRSKVYVVEISPLGLVEMTRKNISDGVREILTRGCDICDGTGRVLSEESHAIDAMRRIRQHVRESKAEAFHVATSPEVAPLLLGAGGGALAQLESETGRYFTIEGIDGLAPGALEFRAEGTREEIESAIPLPYAEGEEVVVRIDEPHMYVEGDAIARVAGGFVVSVTGAGRYLGEEHRVRIDRVMRTGAFATLLDAEPAIVAPDGEVDRESDLLEPERKIGERVDVEGRVKRQRRGRAPRKDEAHLAGRGAEDADIVSEDDEERERAERAAAASMKEAALAAKRAAEEDVDDDEAGDEDDDVVDDDGVAPARRRRRRRGGRGRKRPVGEGMNGTLDGAGDASGAPRPERVPEASGDQKPERAPEGRERAPAQPAAVSAGTAASADGAGSDPDAPARRRRRRGGRGRGGRSGAAANGAASVSGGTTDGRPPAQRRPPGGTAANRPPRVPRPPREEAPASPPPAPVPVATTATAPPAEPKKRRGILGRILKGD